MSARHRVDKRGGLRRETPVAEEPVVEEARRHGRWGRRVAWFAAALVLIGVALGALYLAGCRSGANSCGKAVEAGNTGQEIFERNCASCHGVAGQGNNGPAFAAGGKLAGLTFAERVEKTGRGKPLNAMPRWRGKLTPTQIRMVAAYTQVLSGQQPEPSVGG